MSLFCCKYKNSNLFSSRKATLERLLLDASNLAKIGHAVRSSEDILLSLQFKTINLGADTSSMAVI